MNPETHDPRFWQEGVAGNCNVVTFDGEDIKGVLWIPNCSLRARVIEAHNKVIRSMELPSNTYSVADRQITPTRQGLCRKEE